MSPTPPDTCVRWDGLLDELEAALDTGAPFHLPADVPPIPPHLGARARALLERQEAAAVELEQQMEEAAAELERHRRVPRPGPTPARGAALSL